MENDYNPLDPDRPPREEGWEEETEEIFEYIRNRGDQRIGQYLLNVLSEYSEDADRVSMLWNLEADELLKAVKQFNENHRGGP